MFTSFLNFIFMLLKDLSFLSRYSCELKDGSVRFYIGRCGKRWAVMQKNDSVDKIGCPVCSIKIDCFIDQVSALNHVYNKFTAINYHKSLGLYE